MWTAEENKKQKFQIVLEAEFGPDDKVDEATCAKITQRMLNDYKSSPSMINPTSIKVVQVEEK